MSKKIIIKQTDKNAWRKVEAYRLLGYKIICGPKDIEVIATNNNVKVITD